MVRLGSLDFLPALEHRELLAPVVAAALESWAGGVPAGDIGVAAIDAELADTAAFCARYGVAPAESANCVVVQARRAERVTFAACVVLATTRADVNGLVRRHLDARKASFGPMEEVVAATGMEYGGITPIGLPAGWPVLIDEAVASSPWLVVGSGVRRSKIALPGAVLAGLPGATVLSGLGR